MAKRILAVGKVNYRYPPFRLKEITYVSNKHIVTDVEVVGYIRD